MSRLTNQNEVDMILKLNPNLNGVPAKQYIKLAQYEELGTVEELAELKKQLENAIVPKFKEKDWVYVIENNKVWKVCLQKPSVEIMYDYAFNSVLSIDDDGQEYFDPDIGNSYEHQIFATKEEAEQKLKELKGESNE